MVHHAYIKYTPHRDATRFVVSAADADTIDEWWRAHQKHKGLRMERMSPDFYTIFLTLIVDAAGGTAVRNGAGMLDQASRTDHISGGTFYVRSKSEPSLYWWAAETGGRIYATRQGRTRFQIRIDAEDDRSKTVMIKSDRVVLCAAHDPKLKVSTEAGELCLDKHSDSFDFGDFKHRFLAGGMYDKEVVKRVDFGFGEEWELVR
ncbi:hypothetical protein EJ05DRAFT_529186 [Pseudovirgaria hyperparasitica]|uniref:Uncharacterized protein n=1 Tax=Pseudovirgaria hyperparasitica TaxID=470096 RepID=A0A6A6W3P9_9PEZI|nr:uncharacterized protein EJ05DRAFT_529186 [Pseudovirgaria hyperparasitica]KAF2757482.1 hypothetical protein EJ05DRAFT_529186 [Pseudovirgaria hyperparasitica]